MVTPQNPLKTGDGMAPFEERFETAKRIACDPRITVTGVETRLGTRYSVDTLSALTRCFPEKKFVWIVGADILAEFPRWKDWPQLFGLVPIAVFDRAPYSVTALAGMAARCFASNRISSTHARTLADRRPPAWTFFPIPRHPANATEIRTGRS
jgi:nicotinate-nucleotide adenylyltransferase